MTIEQMGNLINRWMNGQCAICLKELKGVPKVTVNCQGVDIDICACHPRP